VVIADQLYRYVRPSQLTGSDGGGAVMLATSGGAGPAGPLLSPAFFAGFIGHAEQAAVALRTCARVARSRFYVPPGTLAAALADPVVTSNGDRLRFESFSSCCGLYARLDVLPAALDGAMLGTGTTNVDFGPPIRHALAQIGGLDPLHLRVGADEVTLATMDGETVERRVPLPGRWLKGFAEVGLAAAGMVLAADLDGAAARSFLRGLPRTWRGPAWAVPAGSGLRISPRHSPGAVCASGPDRLRAAEPLTRFVTGLRVYASADAAGLPSASAWEFALDASRFTLVLSPEVSRGFSGEGQVLAYLADDQAGQDAAVIAALLAWQPRIDLSRLAAAAVTGDRATRALGRLGAAGRVGYDLAEGCYFHRELPYDPQARHAMHPRLTDARALVAAGAVEFTADGAVVDSGGVGYRITRDAGGAARCTCPWWGRHRGTRGPCKHVLAAALADSSVAPGGSAAAPGGSAAASPGARP
jgi:hypothetical protein